MNASRTRPVSGRTIGITAIVVLVLVIGAAWWFGRPVPRSGGPLNMGDITYSSMVCASNTACTSADAMLRNSGDADIVVRSIELLDVSDEGIGAGQAQLYIPTAEPIGSTSKGYPPVQAQPANVIDVAGGVLPAHRGNGDDRHILIPLRPTAAGHYWWQGYQVRYEYRGIEYVLTQPSWVTVCVDGVGRLPDGACEAKRPADEQ